MRLYRDAGIGFVVYKCEMTFKEGAVFGDSLEIRTTVRAESEYRAVFNQQVWRPNGRTALVEGLVQLVCVNRDKQLVPLPADVMRALTG